MRSRTPSLAVLALAAALPAAAQDLTIVSKATHDGGPPVTTTSYLTGDHVRFTQTEGQEMIMDLKSGQMTVIDGRKKEYYVITHQDIDQAMARAREAMNSPEVKRAQEQMKSLPPDVQKKMQAMMGGVASSIDVQKTGSTRKIAGYTCQDWTVTMGGMTKTEECLTSDLALPAQSWDTFRDYADSFKTMTANMGPMSQGMADMQAKMKAMKGFPLARKTTVSVLGRTTTSSTEVVEIKKGSVPASAWEIPAGYKKVENPMLAASARPRRR